MTTRIWFQPHATSDPATGVTLINSDVQFYLDITFTNPLTFYDAAGIQGSKYHVGAYPMIPDLSFDLPDGTTDIWAKSGDFKTMMTSVPALKTLAANTYTAVTAAAGNSAKSASDSATAATQAATAAAARSPQGSLRILRATSGGTGTGWSDGVTVYTSRPAYNGPIRFMSNLSRKPAADGVITGGGGMVPALDEWVQWTAQ